jgi:K+-sensing histidine kinase KdpD
MLHNQSTTRVEVVELPGDVEALVVARGRAEARPIVSFLKDQRINLALANDADAAFEEVLVHRPHIVLVEDDVPPTGGIAFCQRLKRNTRTHFVPTILFARDDDPEHRLRALEAGVDAIFAPSTDAREQRIRFWALLRTQAIHRRLESKQRSKGQQMQERRRWFGAFIHDLQNSVAALRANFEYLGQVAQLPTSFSRDETDDCLRDSHALFRDLVRGFRTVLDFERLEAGRLALHTSPLRIGDLMRAVQSDLEWQATSGGKSIEVDLETPEPPIHADRELLRQALENLTGHALRQKAVRRLTLRVRSRGGATKAWIQGDGPVVAEPGSERLFEPYARRGGVAEGYGVGLALAKLVVDLHRGSLWVEEGPRGSMFALELKSEESSPKLRSVG